MQIFFFKQGKRKSKRNWVSACNLISNQKKLFFSLFFRVDWGPGAIFPFYADASANTRLVGRQICLVIKAIRKLYYANIWDKDLNVHCIGIGTTQAKFKLYIILSFLIGHSLGAHTCGYAGEYCDGKFDRITGLTFFFLLN